MHPDGRCGDAPERLVDYVPDVPEAGRDAIQVPTIGVNSDGLFYLLNWNTPLGAPEGPGGFVMHLPDGASEPVRLATVPGGGSPSRQGLAVTQTAAIDGDDGVRGFGAARNAEREGECEPEQLFRAGHRGSWPAPRG